MKRLIALAGLLGCTALGLYLTTAGANGKDDFMEKAARMGMAEVQFGNLGVQKAQAQAVRDFAQMMVDEHTRSNQELMSMAASKNTTLPTTLDNKHTEEFNDLNRLTGSKFDQEFMEEMEDDHEDAVALFRKASMNHSDPDVKTWAATTLPTLERHLAMARSIRAGARGTNGTGTSNMDMSHGNSNMNGDSNNRNSNTNRSGNRNYNAGNSNSNMNMNTGNGNLMTNRAGNGNSNSGNRNSNGTRNSNSNSNSNSNRPRNSNNGNSNGNTGPVSF